MKKMIMKFGRPENGGDYIQEYYCGVCNHIPFGVDMNGKPVMMGLNALEVYRMTATGERTEDKALMMICSPCIALIEQKTKEKMKGIISPFGREDGGMVA